MYGITSVPNAPEQNSISINDLTQTLGRSLPLFLKTMRYDEKTSSVPSSSNLRFYDRLLSVGLVTSTSRSMCCMWHSYTQRSFFVLLTYLFIYSFIIFSDPGLNLQSPSLSALHIQTVMKYVHSSFLSLPAGNGLYSRTSLL